MNYVDAKYVGLISSRLENFKKKTNTLYNFRCPICGDSEKNRYKARGYLYPSTDGSGFIFKCHNCGEVKSLAGLIKMLDHTLYQKYLLEGFGKKDKRFSTKASRKKKTPKISVSYLEKLGAERVDRIPKNHAVHKFINDRRIPDSSLDIFIIYMMIKTWRRLILYTEIESEEISQGLFSRSSTGKGLWSALLLAQLMVRHHCDILHLD